MNYCNVHYETKEFEDKDQGCAGLELIATTKEETKPVSRITFWDAEGKYYIELYGAELPLQVIEQFVQEAKHQIKVN